MKKLLLPFLSVFFCMLLLSSCGSGNVSVKQQRDARTGIGGQEKAAIVLERYVKDGQRKDSGDKEEEIVDCLRRGMDTDGQTIETITGSDFRTTLFPGMDYEREPRSPEALLELLSKKEDVRERVLAMTVRYLIVVDIQTSSRRSIFRATVLDVKSRARAGELSADATGRIGSNLPMLSLPEREACAGLGRAVYNFILSPEGPAPARTQ